ncbi:MAG: TolC family protein [Balneolaceae bacterium]|nr:TolC family protein [Balneolaceae bacterium]
MTKKLGVWATVLLFSIFAAPASNVLAQQSGTDNLTLSKAIQMALANNPDVKRALLATEDSDELVKIAYSNIYPNISSSINYTRNIEIPVSFLPGEFFGGQPGTLVPVAFGTDNNWQGGFTVTQTLFRGETIIGLSSATVYRTVQDENFRAVSQQIVTQTRIAYYQVLVAKEQLRLQQSQIKRLEQNLSENQRRRDAGLVDEYAVLQLQVQLSNQKPLLIEAEYGLMEAYRNLKYVIGVPYAYDFKVEGNLNDIDILADDDVNNENADIKQVDQMNPFTYQVDVVNEALLSDNRGDLRTIDAQLDLKDQEITAIKSRFLPTLNATYNLQWSSAEPDAPTFFENNVRFQTLGINLSLPLFEGFKRVADVQRAQISRKDLEEQYRAGLLRAQNEVASASEDLNMAFETANARKIALEQAQEGYERAKLRFDNGLGSQIEVTEAEVQVRQAEVNYAVMVFNYLTAKAQYDLATGIVPFIDRVPSK